MLLEIKVTAIGCECFSLRLTSNLFTQLRKLNDAQMGLKQIGIFLLCHLFFDSSELVLPLGHCQEKKFL